MVLSLYLLLPLLYFSLFLLGTGIAFLLLSGCSANHCSVLHHATLRDGGYLLTIAGGLGFALDLMMWTAYGVQKRQERIKGEREEGAVGAA